MRVFEASANIIIENLQKSSTNKGGESGKTKKAIVNMKPFQDSQTYTDPDIGEQSDEVESTPASVIHGSVNAVGIRSTVLTQKETLPPTFPGKGASRRGKLCAVRLSSDLFPRKCSSSKSFGYTENGNSSKDYQEKSSKARYWPYISLSSNTIAEYNQYAGNRIADGRRQRIHFFYVR